MNNVSIIKTNRLQIVPFSERHLTPHYVNWLNDKKVVQYSQQRHYKHTLESCRTYWLSFANTPHFFWAIELLDTMKTHIGNMNAYIDTINQIADVGIIIGEPSAQKKGYGLEAWQAVCKYLLNVQSLRKISAGTLSANHAMLNIMQRSGMIEDGKRFKHCIADGKEVDLCHYALFHEPI